MNINDLCAMAVSSEFKVFDLSGVVHFKKYCQETKGRSVSLYHFMNIHDLGAMAVSFVV